MRDIVEDRAVLTDRVAAVRAYLAAGGGQVPVRVAASVTQLGLAARLISPSLALAVHGGGFLVMGDAYWQSELAGAFPLSVTGRSTDKPDELIDILRRVVAAARTFSVSDRVLWGNVASAVNGAATMIATARSDLAQRATTVANDLLNLEPLQGNGFRHKDGHYQRSTCCLIYRASPEAARNALCGDCVLNRHSARQGQERTGFNTPETANETANNPTTNHNAFNTPKD